MQQERTEAGVPLLTELAAEGSAEAAFYLGVGSVRSGDLAAALVWMERALDLNPDHPETRQQVENLRRAVAGR